MGHEDRDNLGPEWLAYRFDEATDTIRFVDYDRETRGSAPFLAVNHLPERPYRAEPRERAKRLAPATAPIQFVFHSGFCCSTLFTRCFDQPGLATGFSEPNILNDVVGWRKRGALPAEVGRALSDAISLLARPFGGDQLSVVKPSTIANGLAAAMLKLRPEASAVLMYAPLEDHLLSLAKKGFDGRLWGRELFMAMRREQLLDRLGLTDTDFLGLMDLQIAACAWLGQQCLFSDLIEKYPGRVRSLSSDAFLARPKEALEGAAGLFQLALTSEQVSAVAGTVLTRNSKDGTAFGASARDDEYRAARSVYGDEVGKVAEWAALVGEAAGIATDLPHPLT
ncbi:hypothetical protein [Sphingomonas sp. URHD0057]|uniref:hypothetical protein n=1 Tax=Sphingomonas sp. URHD0057 TaxID=1380389 RepID=UPI00048D5A0A|nr:hypothetical protein [Sphingomonas sp. URHD0057]